MTSSSYWKYRISWSHFGYPRYLVFPEAWVRGPCNALVLLNVRLSWWQVLLTGSIEFLDLILVIRGICFSQRLGSEDHAMPWFCLTFGFYDDKFFLLEVSNFLISFRLSEVSVFPRGLGPRTMQCLGFAQYLVFSFYHLKYLVSPEAWVRGPCNAMVLSST